MRNSPQISGASSMKEPQTGAVNPLRTFLCPWPTGLAAPCMRCSVSNLANHMERLLLSTYVTAVSPLSPTARHLDVSSLVAFADSPVVEALKAGLDRGWTGQAKSATHRTVLSEALASDLKVVDKEGACIGMEINTSSARGSQDFLSPNWHGRTFQEPHGRVREHSKAASRRRIEWHDAWTGAMEARDAGGPQSLISASRVGGRVSNGVCMYEIQLHGS